MKETSTEQNDQTIGICADCERVELLTGMGLCKFCTPANGDSEDELRECLNELVEEHDLPSVFWALDNIYNEFDDRMAEIELP